MFCYIIKGDHEMREVREWIVYQNGGPQKYFTNPAIKKWWREDEEDLLLQSIQRERETKCTPFTQ